jgi:hypothetical protein
MSVAQVRVAGHLFLSNELFDDLFHFVEVPEDLAQADQ